MFENLDEVIRHDATVGISRTERIVKWMVVGVVSVVLFGGLYFVVRLLD
jgi:hypothetical protein